MEIVTISIGLGLILSLLLAELYGLSAGGMVVPGYMALFLDRPLIIVYTLLAALITMGLVRFAARYVIVYGKRRVALTILTGFIIGMTMNLLATMTFGFGNTTVAEPADFAVVGFIIPGLLALWMDRQGLRDTVCVVALASGLVRLSLIVVGLEVLA